MELFFEILIALFSLFGLWCLLHLVADALLGSSAIGTVIYVSDERTEKELYELLQEAVHPPFGRRGAPLLVLYSEDYEKRCGGPDAATLERIARAGGRAAVARQVNATRQ